MPLRPAGLVALKMRASSLSLPLSAPQAPASCASCRPEGPRSSAHRWSEPHLAKGRTAPVAVIIVDIVLQLLQRPAHQHGTACIREGLHRRTALGGKDLSARLVKEKLSTMPDRASPSSR